MVPMSKYKPTLRTTGMVTVVAMTMVNTALQVMAQDDFDPLGMESLDTTDQTHVNDNEEDQVEEEETWDDDVDSARMTGDRSQNMDEDASIHDNEDNDDDDEASLEPDTEEDEQPQPEIIGTLDTKDIEPPTDYAPEVLDVAGNEDEEDTFEADDDDDDEGDDDEEEDKQQQQRKDDEELKQELAEEVIRQQDFRNSDDDASLNQQIVEEEYDSHDGMVIDQNDIATPEEELDTTEDDDVTTDKQEYVLPPPILHQQVEEKHDLDQELVNEGFEEEEEEPDVESQSDDLLATTTPATIQQQPIQPGDDIRLIKDWQTNDDKHPMGEPILHQNEWAEGSEDDDDDELGKIEEEEQDEADLSDLATKSQAPDDILNPPATEAEIKGSEETDEGKERVIQAPPIGVPPPPIDDNKVTEQYDQKIDNSLEKALEMDAANVPWYDDSNAKDEDPDLLNKEIYLSEGQLTQGQQPGTIHSDTAPAFATADQKSGYRSSTLMLLIVLFMILFILRKGWLKMITRQKNSTSLPFYRNTYSKQSLD